MLAPILLVNQTNAVYSAVLIFLSGSCTTPASQISSIQSLVGDAFSFPYIKIMFPTAPLVPYTPRNGSLCNVWFDRLGISPKYPESVSTINFMGEEIKKLIDNIVQGGIPHDRIIVGGFSMGGAMALHTSYRFSPGMPGIFALSSFLNDNSLVYREFKNNSTKLFMRHGKADDLVDLEWAQETFDELRKLGVQGSFRSYENTSHELNKDELLDVINWVKTVLHPLVSDK